MQTIFGPVHSRRFGVSLGIDLSAGIKQCNFDCLYCELAPSAAITRQMVSIPVSTILDELRIALTKHPDLDVITITANGEPTMYPFLGELIEQIDEIKGDIQTLILSNSAALSTPSVFETLLKIDQVKLSLDAATERTFAKIDRPAKGITIETIIASIQNFSQHFQGKLFIEILFVKGINDSLEEIRALNDVLLPIRCERIDIGTIDRPPAYPVNGLNFEELFSIAEEFDPSLPIHIVSRKRAEAIPSSYTDEEILATLDKRPLSDDDVRALFDSQTLERFTHLLNEGKITSMERTNVVFYLPTQNLHRKRSK